MKKNQRKQKPTKSNGKLQLTRVEPKTANQQKMINSFEDNDVVVAHGYPGTGKSFMALYLALSELEINPEFYERVHIIRSSVSTRELGFLPGKADEKMKEFEVPYEKICEDLYNRGDAYGILKQKGVITFSSSSFLRSVTFTKSIIIVDEFQNMSYQELCTIITRIGEDCKMIFIGDIEQDDLTSERFNEKSGALTFINLMKKISNTGFVSMEIEDIVRSQYVKNFIIEKVKYEKNINYMQ